MYTTIFSIRYDRGNVFSIAVLRKKKKKKKRKEKKRGKTEEEICIRGLVTIMNLI